MAINPEGNVWVNGGLRLLFALWLGAQLTVGYAVAPLLFARLDDRALAGAIAGELFHGVAWLGLAVALVHLLRQWRRRTWRLWTWGVVALVAGVSLFVVQPMMAELKAAGLGDPEVAARFGRLHGLSSGLYLLQSLAGVALALGGPCPQRSMGAFSEGR